MTVGGRVLRYTAKAGLIPIRDNETGDAHGHVFFVSYTLERASGGGRRPVTFVWNGGPGANSTLVHLSGFGPRRIGSTDDPAKPTPIEPALEDNETTWLGATDLVFVDPVSTGPQKIDCVSGRSIARSMRMLNGIEMSIVSPRAHVRRSLR